jgi:CrcB protein
MLRIAVAVFVGGGIGALLRELLMLGVRQGYDGFPLDILAANVVGAFVLGVAAALHARARIGDIANALVGTGFCGGLTTFSSFVYASVVLMAASTREAAVAVIYVVVSLVVGYVAVRLGERVGGAGRHAAR